MKIAYDNSFLIDAKADFYGINLGADYCAEHEWGISDIRSDFGIKKQPNAFGLEACKVMTVPPLFSFHPEIPALIFGSDPDYVKNLLSLPRSHKPIIPLPPVIVQGATIQTQVRSLPTIHEISFSGNPVLKDSFSILYQDSTFTITFNEEELFQKFYQNYDLVIKGEGIRYGVSGLATAWDGSSFAIRTSKKHREKLAELWNAFNELNVSIYLGGGGVFQNAGLRFAIYTKIPEEIIQKALELDKNHELLQQTAAQTGIHGLLAQKGKKFYALRPEWKNKTDIKTQYDVVFWLNPMEQSKYNFGWFTVEDLQLWAEDKGPVIKN